MKYLVDIANVIYDVMEFDSDEEAKAVLLEESPSDDYDLRSIINLDTEKRLYVRIEKALA